MAEKEPKDIRLITKPGGVRNDNEDGQEQKLPYRPPNKQKYDPIRPTYKRLPNGDPDIWSDHS